MHANATWACVCVCTARTCRVHRVNGKHFPNGSALTSKTTVQLPPKLYADTNLLWRWRRNFLHILKSHYSGPHNAVSNLFGAQRCCRQCPRCVCVCVSMWIVVFQCILCAVPWVLVSIKYNGPAFTSHGKWCSNSLPTYFNAIFTSQEIKMHIELFRSFVHGVTVIRSWILIERETALERKQGKYTIEYRTKHCVACHSACVFEN